MYRSINESKENAALKTLGVWLFKVRSGSEWTRFPVSDPVPVGVLSAAWIGTPTGSRLRSATRSGLRPDGSEEEAVSQRPKQIRGLEGADGGSGGQHLREAQLLPVTAVKTRCRSRNTRRNKGIQRRKRNRCFLRTAAAEHINGAGRTGPAHFQNLQNHEDPAEPLPPGSPLLPVVQLCSSSRSGRDIWCLLPRQQQHDDSQRESEGAAELSDSLQSQICHSHH
ncbi:uncharacterized protein LOC122823910 isoform X2 [Gambusia affinis]|uniref:uncharacterized protein LOC122823910 isoform X2 n=1 Tax=Gambusia affinis TaxID=33528 RepID=UPI001CDD420F|nr:uncharacterized protein LOC122823910 isoform X2 [Gambusia affinis]